MQLEDLGGRSVRGRRSSLARTSPEGSHLDASYFTVKESCRVVGFKSGRRQCKRVWEVRVPTV